MNIRVLLVVVFLKFNFLLFGQQALPLPVNIQTLYEKSTRSRDGKPGINYWQNSANYDIHVAFDPSTLLLNGAEKISYTNNSPD
ncbi:MAG TPA: peptidase, partial [Segetibacter sp.]